MKLWILRPGGYTLVCNTRRGMTEAPLASEAYDRYFCCCGVRVRRLNHHRVSLAPLPHKVSRIKGTRAMHAPQQLLLYTPLCEVYKG